MIRAILTSGSMRSLRQKPDRSCATKPGHISCHRQLSNLMLGFVDETTDTGGWTYSIQDKVVDFLAAGETAMVKYNVTVDDGHSGGTATQLVTVTLNGANEVVTLNGTKNADALNAAYG